MNGQLQIKKAETENQIHEIADLAAVIWEEHFTPIIGEEQVAYMVEKFQSFLPCLSRSGTDMNTISFPTAMNSAATAAFTRRTDACF